MVGREVEVGRCARGGGGEGRCGREVWLSLQ